MIQKTVRYILLAVALVCAFILATRLMTPEDTWLCVDGAWVKHGNPSAPMPQTGCGSGELDSMIRVQSPTPGQAVQSPLVITGQARGTWFFEASFPVRLVKKDGTEIASGIATAQSDWMTEEFVPFSATLTFASDVEQEAELVLVKDNPSGLPENDDERRMPVRVMNQNTMAVKIFLGSSVLNPNAMDCSLVYPLVRIVEKSQAVGRAALEELLKGASQAEKEQGYFSSLNSGVALESLKIENRVAYAAFDEALERAVGGSCRVSAIRAQIVETLKQFSGVDSVVISIDGRTEDILQP